MTIDRYGKALGIWNLTVGGANLDLKPTKGDNRKFTKIISSKETKNNQALLFERFGDFMLGLIQRDYPPIDDAEKEIQELYVEFNVNGLFEEIMVTFGWSSREEMDKAKALALGDIKKLTAES